MAIQQLVGFENTTWEETTFKSGNTTVGTTPVRTGVYALEIDKTVGSAVNYVQYGTPTTTGINGAVSVATAYITFYLRWSALPSAGDEEFCSLSDSGTFKAGITASSSGVVKIWKRVGANPVLVDTGSTAMTTGTWYRIDVKVGTETGGGGNAPYEVKIDDNVEFSGTDSFGSSNVAWVSLGSRFAISTATYKAYFDDFAWSDTAYPSDSGIIEVHGLFPDANGNYVNWVKNTGAAMWTHVDDSAAGGRHDTDATYLYTNVLGREFSVSVEDPESASTNKNQVLPKPCNILAVKGHWWTRKEDASPAVGLRYLIRYSSTDSYTGADDDPSTGYDPRYYLLTQNPSTSAAWKRSELDSIELGVKYNLFSGNMARCTAALLSVLCVPAAGTGPRHYTPHAGI
jgi:hypothetical protein